jgi:two-component system phosphate regulon sensor histidine kinase PhoR
MASLLIRSSTVRLVIFISSFILATIIVFQLVWLKKVYHLEEKEFNHNIVKTFRGLYEDLEINSYNFTHLNELIQNTSPDLYLANVPMPIDKDSLMSYLQYELEDNGVFANCVLGVYSASAGKYIYTEPLTFPGSKKLAYTTLPESSNRNNHIALYFPNRRQYILSEMNFWIISSVVLFVVLILLAGSLFYFYRQKFVNETQRDFIHSFTHEFKTPVAVISLAAEVLKNPAIVQKPDKLLTYAGIVEYQSAYLQSQVQKLLKFAHTEANQLHLSKEKVNLHTLIQEAVKNLGPLIDERNAVVTYELQLKDPILYADKDYLVIVITNLLDNAIKYARTPKVFISTKKEGEYIHLTVEDNGIGIQKSQMKNVFKKFFRVVDGDAYASKGFGLGLSFVKLIVQAHKGKIKLESQYGNGSRFTIELPA